MIDFITILEIGNHLFTIETLFGFVFGYPKGDTFNLQYGTEDEWYIETWHGVDSELIMKTLKGLGWWGDVL